MATSLPVLTFHALDDLSSVISFSPKIFQLGIAKLYERGYRTLNLLEAINCLQREQPFPDRSFVITFDDGYETVYEEAFPTLCRFGMSATVFLTVGERRDVKAKDRLPSLEGRAMLGWSEIREMERQGIAFGAHTLTHPDLTQLSMDRMQTEICHSKAIIEDNLGSPVLSFAAPYSRYDQRSLELIRHHFACACTDELGLITAYSDVYGLERVDACYLRSPRLFDLMLTPFFPWYIRMRSIPRSIRRAFRAGLR